MAVSIIPVRSEQDLTTFVDLPWTVYADQPLWVPPIKSQDRELLTPGAHPFWESARRELFLALDGPWVALRPLWMKNTMPMLGKPAEPSVFLNAWTIRRPPTPCLMKPGTGWPDRACVSCAGR